MVGWLQHCGDCNGKNLWTWSECLTLDWDGVQFWLEHTICDCVQVTVWPPAAVSGNSDIRLPTCSPLLCVQDTDTHTHSWFLRFGLIRLWQSLTLTQPSIDRKNKAVILQIWTSSQTPELFLIYFQHVSHAQMLSIVWKGHKFLLYPLLDRLL